MAGEVLLGDGGPDEALLREEVGPGEHVAYEAEVGEAVLLEEGAIEPGDGHLEVEEAPGKVEGLGGRALVLEAAGVADEAGVEAHGGVLVEGQAEDLDQAGDDDGGGGGPGIDEVDGAVAGVREVVVDHDELVGGPSGAGELAQTLDRPAVEGDHDLGLGREPLRVGEHVEAGQLPVVRPDDLGTGEGGDRVPPGGAQHVVEGEHRAQRVAVGGHVTGERHPTGVADGSRRLGHFGLRDPRHGAPGAAHSSSSEWSRRMICSTRSPRATAGSSLNTRLGRYLSRTCRPRTARRCGEAERSASAVPS